MSHQPNRWIPPEARPGFATEIAALWARAQEAAGERARRHHAPTPDQLICADDARGGSIEPVWTIPAEMVAFACRARARLSTRERLTLLEAGEALPLPPRVAFSFGQGVGLSVHGTRIVLAGMLLRSDPGRRRVCTPYGNFAPRRMGQTPTALQAWVLHGAPEDCELPERAPLGRLVTTTVGDVLGAGLPAWAVVPPRAFGAAGLTGAIQLAVRHPEGLGIAKGTPPSARQRVLLFGWARLVAAQSEVASAVAAMFAQGCWALPEQ